MRLILVVFGLLYAIAAFTQEKANSLETNRQFNGKSAGKFFVVDDQYPGFNGGTIALNSFIRQNIRYPLLAGKKGTEGRVMLNFIVEANGTLTNFQVVRGIGDGCDEEAVRIMKLSPKWKPGIKAGKRVRYGAAVSFILNEL